MRCRTFFGQLAGKLASRGEDTIVLHILRPEQVYLSSTARWKPRLPVENARHFPRNSGSEPYSKSITSRMLSRLGTSHKVATSCSGRVYQAGGRIRHTTRIVGAGSVESESPKTKRRKRLRRFGMGTLVIWRTVRVSCSRHPAPKTCAWGAPDEGVRGYTRFGLVAVHVAHRVHQIYGVVRHVGIERLQAIANRLLAAVIGHGIGWLRGD